MGDDDAVGQRGVRDARQPPIAVGVLPEEPPRTGAPSDHGRAEAVVHRIGHDPEHRHPVLDESQRDRPVAVDRHIVQRAVDRVEHPDATAPGVDRVPLLPQQRVARGGQALGDEGLDAAIDLGDDVVAVALGVDAQLLPRVEPEPRPRADRVESEREQPVQLDGIALVGEWCGLRARQWSLPSAGRSARDHLARCRCGPRSRTQHTARQHGRPCGPAGGRLGDPTGRCPNPLGPAAGGPPVTAC